MNTLISSSKEIERRIIIPSAKKYSLRNIPDSISVIEVKGILMVESSITLSGKTIDAKEGQIIISDTCTLTLDKDCKLILGSNPIEITNIDFSSTQTNNHHLQGNFTHIEAPISRIFSDAVRVGGDWNIDRAYPEWFGAVAYSEYIDDNQPPIFSTEAIQKAINMKTCGVVFFHRGFYYINDSIEMLTGICLSGESAIYKRKKTNINSEDNPNVITGSVIVAKPKADCTNNFAIYIGKQKGNDAAFNPFSPMYTSIENMAFVYAGDEEGGLRQCIKTYDSTELNHVIFYDFQQAVCFADNYIDGKKVTNCTFYCYKAFGEKLYAFDMGSLGDALLFEHNAIHSGTYNHGLRLNRCGGGSINSNIINADILIKYCKGITFEANHIEQGHKVEILSSQAALQSNYLWLGVQPSVQIYGDKWGHGSVVSMDGNVFRFYDSRFFSNHTDSNKEGYYLNTDKYKIDYDVAIDKYSTLSINNLYRYWIGQSFGTMGTTGIKIGKMDIDWNNSSNPETAFAAFDDFNNLSYALSQSSHIGQHFNVRAHFAVKDATTAPLNPVFMKNSGTMWVAESGTYCYYYQRIVDRSHNIATTKAQISQYDSSNNSISSSCNIELEQSREGVLLNLNNQGKTFILRLIRIKIETDKISQWYVDVPITGNAIIYDNGVSVNGYKWINSTQSPEVASKTNIKALQYNDGMVKVFELVQNADNSNQSNVVVTEYLGDVTITY